MRAASQRAATSDALSFASVAPINARDGLLGYLRGAVAGRGALNQRRVRRPARYWTATLHVGVVWMITGWSCRQKSSGTWPVFSVTVARGSNTRLLATTLKW